MNSPADRIHIVELELSANVGVTEDERGRGQRLSVSVTLEPMRQFSELADEIEHATDYEAVCQTIDAIVRDRPRKLIETLAEEIAAGLLSRYTIRAVDVELRKYILPRTRHVAVHIYRSRAPQ